MSLKKERHRQILDLLARNEIESQEQLLALLTVEGVTITQSTLSRDLRELGVVKRGDGYRQGSDSDDSATPLERLGRSLAGEIESADHGGQVAVVRPRAGVDPKALAARIEAAGLHQLVSAMAADDRVLVVARSPAYAREWVRALHRAPKRSTFSWLRGR